MAANSSCTRSLGGSHPICWSFTAGLHGFTGCTLTVGVSHGAPASLIPEMAAYVATAAFPASVVQGARPADILAKGRGSAASRINLTACGNDGVPERFAMISMRIATARMLL